jgi:hypothetical protein
VPTHRRLWTGKAWQSLRYVSHLFTSLFSLISLYSVRLQSSSSSHPHDSVADCLAVAVQVLRRHPGQAPRPRELRLLRGMPPCCSLRLVYSALTLSP